MKAKSARIYLVHHEDGLVTATALRSREYFWDTPPPSAVGPDAESAASFVDVVLREMHDDDADLERYLWDEDIVVETSEVEIHALSATGGSPVIGARKVPLRVSYARAAIEGGGVRVIVPRFSWSFVCEHQSLAPALIRTLIQGSLVGKSPRSLLAYRHGVRELVTARPVDFEWKERTGEGADAKNEMLDAVADEWTERAERRRLPGGVLGRPRIDPEPGWLDRKPLPSFVLVGPAGSGKTAEVRRLAHHLAARKKAKLGATRLYATSGERLIAGMIYLGQWQERVLDVALEMTAEGGFLYVDHLGSILKPQSDGGTIADLLLPGIASDSFALIAECTPREWERAQRLHPELAAQLVVVEVPETSTEAMPEMLREAQLLRTPLVTFTPDALRRLVTHLALLDRTQAFPGKGIRFLEWLAPSPDRARPRVLAPLDVSEAYASHAGLPVALVADEHTRSVAELTASLAEGVIGQPAACAIAAGVLARFKAGLADPERPLGAMLFVGPTGVGKTELAKQLARTMLGDAKQLVRIDCGELVYGGSAARLLATGEGSESLAVRVRARPLSLVLFDEIEKAHADVLDLLLGVLGEGRLTDASGRDVDFRGAVIVMTSNLGLAESATVGFGDGRGETVALRRVRAHFRPELWARIDEVVPFRDLEPLDLAKIVRLALDDVRRREGLVSRGITLGVTEALEAELARAGYEPGRGARPLKRVIEERVVTPLAIRLARDPGLRNKALVLDVAGWID